MLNSIYKYDFLGFHVPLPEKILQFAAKNV